MEKKFVKPEELEVQVMEENMNVNKAEEANAKNSDFISQPSDDINFGNCLC